MIYPILGARTRNNHVEINDETIAAERAIAAALRSTCIYLYLWIRSRARTSSGASRATSAPLHGSLPGAMTQSFEKLDCGSHKSRSLPRRDARTALSISELAAELSSERSVIARDVAVLERDGLLSVAIDPKDRRVRNVVLTKAGRARLRSAGPAWRRAQQQMREALGQALADDVLGITRAVVAALEDP